jgi:phosphotransferase system HPr (HPr) family protein
MSGNETVTRRVRIVNRSGLHARPCHALVTTALRFEAEVRVRNATNERLVNGKSILDLMTIEAPEGTELEFIATGGDASALVEALATLVASGFDER